LKVQQYNARTYHNISTIEEKCDEDLLLQRKKEVYFTGPELTES
jgi:hypothetical protein